MNTLKINGGNFELSVTLTSLTSERLVTEAVSFVKSILNEDAAARYSDPMKIWKVVLTEVGDRKIEVIKQIRAEFNLTLREAKDATERGRTILYTTSNGVEASEIVKRLCAVGAKAEVELAA